MNTPYEQVISDIKKLRENYSDNTSVLDVLDRLEVEINFVEEMIQKIGQIRIPMSTFRDMNKHIDKLVYEIKEEGVYETTNNG